MKGIKHPSKYKKEWTDDDHTKIKSDEKLVSITGYQVIDRENDSKTDIFFYVVEKGNKAIAKSLMHRNGDSKVSIAAEYPIEDSVILQEEIQDKTLTVAAIMIHEQENNDGIVEDTSLTVNVKVPGFSTIKIPNYKALITQLKENPVLANHYLPILNNAFGITDKSNAITEMIMTLQVDPNAKPEVIGKSAEEKKREEQALIKKFGKKNIEDLAKKINYKGEIVNNQ